MKLIGKYDRGGGSWGPVLTSVRGSNLVRREHLSNGLFNEGEQALSGRE